MNVKLCPNCGTRNLDTALVCSNVACGSSLLGVNVVNLQEDNKPSDTNSSHPQASAKTYQMPKEPSKWRTALLSCLIPSVVLICSIDVIAWIIMQFNNFDMGDFFQVMFGACLSPLIIAPFWLFGWLWLFPLIDCIKNEPMGGNDRIIWTLVCLFTGLIGGGIYLIVRRPQRIAMYGQ